VSDLDRRRRGARHEKQVMASANRHPLKDA